LRNLIICIPAAYLLLAHAITQLPVSKIGHASIALALAGVFLYNLIYTQDYYTLPSKEQFREAVEYIADQQTNYEDSIVIGYTHNFRYLDYYFDKSGSEQHVALIAGSVEDIPTANDLIRTKNPRYIWYIAAHLTPSPEFIEFLTENYTLIHQKSFLYVNVWLFENQ
jgi:hypothetical protein